MNAKKSKCNEGTISWVYYGSILCKQKHLLTQILPQLFTFLFHSVHQVTPTACLLSTTSADLWQWADSWTGKTRCTHPDSPSQWRCDSKVVLEVLIRNWKSVFELHIRICSISGPILLWCSVSLTVLECLHSSFLKKDTHLEKIFCCIKWYF